MSPSPLSFTHIFIIQGVFAAVVKSSDAVIARALAFPASSPSSVSIYSIVQVLLSPSSSAFPASSFILAIDQNISAAIKSSTADVVAHVHRPHLYSHSSRLLTSFHH